MTTVTTFTDFLLESERKYPRAKGSFTLLMVQLENAAKIIASHVRESGLADIIGTTGKLNSFQEEVQKLDVFCNQLLINTLTASGQTYALISEEVEDVIKTPSSHQGEYVVYFDPLDGSSNIGTNSPIGTIFSIYHKDGDILQPGNLQVASGYVIYGSSVMLVYTDGKEVNGFTLDPSMGSFLLSHPNMKIPEEGTIYSINEGYSELYTEQVKLYLSGLKKKPKISLRYVGSMIADIHRTLLKGGIFLYPADSKHPEGKLRLMLEANPMSLLIQTAGGMSTTGKENPLDVSPQHIHQRTPLALGSTKNVTEYVSYLT